MYSPTSTELLRGVEACRIRHVSRLLTTTRAEYVTYQSQTTCRSRRLPSSVSPSSFSELAYCPGSASFRTTAHTDLSSAFFLHLLTPIDFISFLTQFNHLNFGLPSSLLPSAFPRNPLLTVLSSDALTSRIFTNSASVSATWTEFKRQPVFCKDNTAVCKVVTEGAGPPRTRGFIPVGATDLSLLQTVHTACGPTCASRSMSTV